MDSFDDFEFKPLTEGLGFHKKNSGKATTINDKNLPPLEPRTKNTALENLNLNSNSLTFETPKFNDPRSQAPSPTIETKIELPDLAPEGNLFSKPLPRTEQDVPKKQFVSTPPTVTIPKFNPRFSKPLANPAIQNQIQSEGLLASLEEQKAKQIPNKVDTRIETQFTEVAPAPLALFLDLTVISGLSILFMLGLVVATSMDIVPVLNHAGEDVGTQLGIALLIYAVSQLYLGLSRTFFGQTLGEWSMDIQLGKPKEQESLSYLFKLIARTIVLVLTGLITLPLISMFLNTDLTGRITGLKLYRK